MVCRYDPARPVRRTDRQALARESIFADMSFLAPVWQITEVNTFWVSVQGHVSV